MKRNQQREQQSPVVDWPYVCEAEVVPGLEVMAAQELTDKLRKAARLLPENEQSPGAIRFRYRGELGRLEQLRLVQAVYVVLHFNVPRPKALLGNQEFRVVISTINYICSINKTQSFKSIHLSAAGDDSSVMQRLINELETATTLKHDKDKGDLWLRIKRDSQKQGWEVLVRTSNRPLATRDWRVCNYEGALNATVAHAMTILSQPSHADTVINLASGSGTLLIERASWGGAVRLIGIENDSGALGCARINITAAAFESQLIQANIKKIPLKDHVANVLLADLPFGQLTGSHQENAVLYPVTLAEAARIATPEAHFVMLTHEIRLMDAILASTRAWTLERQVRITLRGLHPRIYVLRKVT